MTIGEQGVDQVRDARHLVKLCDDGNVAVPGVVFGSCDVSVVGGGASVSWSGDDSAEYRIFRSADGGASHWRGKVTGDSFSDSLRSGPTFSYRVQQKVGGVWATTIDCGTATI